MFPALSGRTPQYRIDLRDWRFFLSPCACKLFGFSVMLELPSEWLLKLLPNSTGVYLRRIKEPPDCRNAL
jgi:hypothetical protein